MPETDPEKHFTDAPPPRGEEDYVTWTPKHGVGTKIAAILILTVLGLSLLVMLLIVFFGG